MLPQRHSQRKGVRTEWWCSYTHEKFFSSVKDGLCLIRLKLNGELALCLWFGVAKELDLELNGSLCQWASWGWMSGKWYLEAIYMHIKRKRMCSNDVWTSAHSCNGASLPSPHCSLHPTCCKFLPHRAGGPSGEDVVGWGGLEGEEEKPGVPLHKQTSISHMGCHNWISSKSFQFNSGWLYFILFIFSHTKHYRKSYVLLPMHLLYSRVKFGFRKVNKTLECKEKAIL